MSDRDTRGEDGMSNRGERGEDGMSDRGERGEGCVNKKGRGRRVARRMKAAEAVARMQEAAEADGKRLRAVRYQSCALEDPVYLHPNSAVLHAAPQYVVYTEVVSSGKRPYMSWVTQVTSAMGGPEVRCHG